jgi:hypothetical protein
MQSANQMVIVLMIEEKAARAVDGGMKRRALPAT